MGRLPEPREDPAACKAEPFLNGGAESMTMRPKLVALAAALLLSGLGGAALRAQDARSLDGIAHVALRVSKVSVSLAFYKTLGWEQAFEFGDDKGTATSYVKVSDRQFIELYRRDSPADPLGLMHICLETRDAERVSAAYKALGLIPTEPRKARAGNLLFSLRDPEGQPIEYAQYLPGSLHSTDRGRHLDDSRISDHLIGAALTVKDVKAEEAFFTGKLGFQGSGPKLTVPGRPDESVGLSPLAAGSKASLTFAADPERAAAELKKRGLEVRMVAGAAVALDPDGVQIVFSLW